jgi:hypothetical protein
METEIQVAEFVKKGTHFFLKIGGKQAIAFIACQNEAEYNKGQPFKSLYGVFSKEQLSTLIGSKITFEGRYDKEAGGYGYVKKVVFGTKVATTPEKIVIAADLIPTEDLKITEEEVANQKELDKKETAEEQAIAEAKKIAKNKSRCPSCGMFMGEGHICKKKLK